MQGSLYTRPCKGVLLELTMLLLPFQNLKSLFQNQHHQNHHQSRSQSQHQTLQTYHRLYLLQERGRERDTQREKGVSKYILLPPALNFHDQDCLLVDKIILQGICMSIYTCTLTTKKVCKWIISSKKILEDIKG